MKNTEPRISLHFDSEKELQDFKDDLYRQGKINYHNYLMSRTRETNCNKKVFSINDLGVYLNE